MGSALWYCTVLYLLRGSCGLLEEVHDEAGHEHGYGVVLLQMQLHQLLQLQREFRLQHLEVALPRLKTELQAKKVWFFPMLWIIIRIQLFYLNAYTDPD